MRRNAQLVAQTGCVVLAASNRITLPNPFRVGFATGGPPFSLHVMENCDAPLACFTFPRIEMRPRGTDSAPYLRAFVASSWIMSAN